MRNAVGALIAAAVGATALAVLPATVSAQGWWPWSQESPRPREPVYRNPPPGQLPPNAPPPGYPPPVNGAGQPPNSAQGRGGNICLQLEQRMVAETQKGGASPRDQLPRIEADYRNLERQLQQAQQKLDRADCYDFFLFTKTLRNSPQCRANVADVDQLRRRMSELDGQRQQIAGSSERRYRDDIVRELARNGCGNQYVQEARRLDNQAGGFWTTEEDASPRTGNQFGALPFATYRTVCVRLCDGYYFPVSFSTLPNHFQRDADLCQSRCAAPVELYYYQNPGANIEQAISARNQSNYMSLKTALKYRKEFVSGCSCKEAEYIAPAGEKKADAGVPGQATSTATVQAVRGQTR